MTEKGASLSYLLSAKLDNGNTSLSSKNKQLPRLMPYPNPNINPDFGLYPQGSLDAHRSPPGDKRVIVNKAPQRISKELMVPSTIMEIEGEEDLPEKLGNSRLNIFGKSTAEKMYFFTGSVERVIKWHKIFNVRPCLFEVIASIVSMQEGSVKLQKIMLLRDDKGPILQVIHYLTNDIQLEDFTMGQKLRCVGYMTGHNILTAISIRLATQDEVGTLQRQCYVADYSISRMLNDERKIEGNNLLLR